MVATPGSTGIGEDQDTLGAVHEGLGFSDIGARRPGLEFLTAIAANAQPARATGDFRHLVDTEAFDDGIKRSGNRRQGRSEEHTSELQSLMRNSYAVFCLKKKTITNFTNNLRTSQSPTHMTSDTPI